MAMEWRDSYKIGDPNIDAQHQHLFALTNQFLVADDKGALTACAMQLYKHTREHFEHEERLMRKVGYPDVLAHTERHNRLLSRLNVISEHIGQDCVNRDDVESLMWDWALHHVPEDDAKLAMYLAA